MKIITETSVERLNIQGNTSYVSFLIDHWRDTYQLVSMTSSPIGLLLRETIKLNLLLQ